MGHINRGIKVETKESIEAKLNGSITLLNIKVPSDSSSAAYFTKADGITKIMEINTGSSPGVRVNGDIMFTGKMDVLFATALEVDDITIKVNKSGNDLTSDGSGLIIRRTTVDKSILYDNTNDRFNINAGLNASSLLVAGVDINNVYAKKIGTDGGQTIYGSSLAGENLTISSTSHATKGLIKLGTSGAIVINEVNLRLGIGTSTPNHKMEVLGNIRGYNFIPGLSTIATSASTTTLSYSDNHIQYFTGTQNQTAVLPVTSTLEIGYRFLLINKSTGILTINSSGGNLVLSLPAGASTEIICISTSGTDATSWNYRSFVAMLGIAGGQTIYGGINASDGLSIKSTSHSTKGVISIGSSTLGLFIDEANNYFGVGVSTPTQVLDVKSGNYLFRGGVFIGDYQASGRMKLRGNSINLTSGGITIQDTTPSTGIDTGAFSVSGGMYIAKGIQFPSTQFASSDPYTLDDYRELTYTTALTCGTSGTITLDSSNNSFQYTKVGRIVFFTGYLSVTSVSSPTGTLLLNVPLTAGNSNTYIGAINIWADGLQAGAVGQLSGYINPNTNAVTIGLFSAGVATTAGMAANIKAGSSFRISGYYFV